ncbi:MAG: DUF4330 family protein [Ruminococcaceae bacterium]|nr:DUF4330 family protein [Oscillospiraceae bacterium]
MNNSANSVTDSSKKKKIGRFNLIDLILVVIILLVIAAVLYVFAPFSWIKKLAVGEHEQIQYTVEIMGVDEALLEKIKENDTVVDSVSKNTLGTVIAIDYNTKYTELQYVQKETDEKEGVLVEYPDRYNVQITIAAEADYVEKEGYSVNHCRIAVGEKMALRFPDFAGEGYCIGLLSE